jgi:uncharacterized phage-associated protein
MCTAKQAASYLIEKSSEHEENDMTNLKLQKMLYFAQATRLSETGTRLFPEEIEAWQYGPVVRTVYNWLKQFGPYAITSFDIKLEYDNLSEDEISFIDKIWIKYNVFSAWHLVVKTHAAGSPWFATFDGGQGQYKVIPESLLMNAAM